MKGIVFTEFLEMVDQKFSADMVDDILNDVKPSSGGIYTSVGTYDHQELVALVQALSERTNIQGTELVKTFGRHLFMVFAKNYRRFFDGVPGAFEFLYGIEEVIHAEVKKLYPDAELPSFICQLDGNTLYMTYHSNRHFADLAEGLILGSANYFNESFNLKREELDTKTTLFTLVKS